MAFPVSPFGKLSIEQMEVISTERNKIGMHAYYTGGMDARKKQYAGTPPGEMLEGGTLTFFFENLSPTGGQQAYFRLGRWDSDLRNYFELSMSDTSYSATKNFGSSDALTFLATPQPVKGPHVLQFFRKADNMEVYLDKQLLFNKDTLSSSISPQTLHVFYTNPIPGQMSPFVFHEAHWSVPDVKQAIESATYRKVDYAFHHRNPSVRVGGYVLWSGVWRPNQTIKLWYGNAIASVPPTATGEAVVVMKMYRNGFTFSHAEEVATIGMDTNYTEFALDRLFMTWPQTLKEYKAVSGEISYQ